LVIDKPEGMTSAQVVARLKKALSIGKIGHTGTLDPFATGVMICCINQATKLARFFLHSSKTYVATLGLGVETDTQDYTGKVTRTREIGDLTESAILEVMGKFRGELLQAPPVYSALKHQGIRLYQLARMGSPIQKPPRIVHIYTIEVTQIRLPEVRFSVSCSAGTYIRTLCADIGQQLGCGGHLKALRRVECGGFNISESIKLPMEPMRSEEILSRLIPMGDALRDMPMFTADHKLAERIKYGRPITKQDFFQGSGRELTGHFKIVDTERHLLAVCEATMDGYRYSCVFPE
jgi:tRNA pseudouridine55 synthase